MKNLQTNSKDHQMGNKKGKLQRNRAPPKKKELESSPLLVEEQSTINNNASGNDNGNSDDANANDDANGSNNGGNGGELSTATATMNDPIRPLLSSVPMYSHSTSEYEWPAPTDDDAAIQRNELRPLPLDMNEIRRSVRSTGKIAVRSITWNQQAQKIPSVEELIDGLFPKGYFHVVAVGTQECENSISKSILNPYKVNWERICGEVLGSEYKLIRGHSLQASHLAVYVHMGIIDLVSNVKSHAVATGICDKLGNKGGIGISFMLGKTSYCFLTAHLAAHQNQIVRRTVEFAKISREVVRELGPDQDETEGSSRRETSTGSTSMYREDDDDDEEEDCFRDNLSILATTNGKRGKVHGCFCPTCPNSFRSCCCCCSDKKEDKFNPLPHSFDHVIWAGDLNFRINGTRDVVDSLLMHNRHDVLVDYDQLNMLIQFESVFAGFEEGDITFRPTYKFDKGTDVYDTSEKRRIPAWTDRVLYKSNPSLQLLSYSSANSVRSSDHRPVYASFLSSVEVGEDDAATGDMERVFTRSESRSEVCVIS